MSARSSRRLDVNIVLSFAVARLDVILQPGQAALQIKGMMMRLG